MKTKKKQFETIASHYIVDAFLFVARVLCVMAVTSVRALRVAAERRRRRWHLCAEKKIKDFNLKRLFIF